jgi:hypothetical protein
LKYAQTQRDIGERALLAAERIARDTGAHYGDVVWLLSRCLAETDTDSPAYKNLHSLITTAKLIYSEELNFSRDMARVEQKRRDMIQAQKKIQTTRKSLVQPYILKRKQDKLWHTFKLIRDYSGKLSALDVSLDSLRTLEAHGLVTRTFFSRKLKVPRKARKTEYEDLPNVP